MRYSDGMTSTKPSTSFRFPPGLLQEARRLDGLEARSNHIDPNLTAYISRAIAKENDRLRRKHGTAQAATES